MVKKIVALLTGFILSTPVFSQNTLTITTAANPTIVCEGEEVNLVATVTEPDNYTYTFDGANDHISIPDDPVFSITPGENFTLEAWVKTVDNRATFSSTVSKGVEGTPGYRLGLKNGMLFGETAIGPVSISTSGVTLVNDGFWHHIAYVADFSSGTFEVYLDGFVDGVSNATPVTPPVLGNSYNMAIGAAYGGVGADHFFFGDIDEVRMWKRALTGSELQNNASTHINPSLHMDLVMYFDLNEGVSGGTVLDCSPTGLIGTPTGGASTSISALNLGWNFGVVWSTGDQGLSVVTKPTVNTTYTAQAGYCKYQTSSDVSITVDPCDSLANLPNNYSTVWVANSFSPNGDLKNDVFLVQANSIVEYEIMIFNRLGNILYHSKNIKNGWDGTDPSGKRVAEGVYAYKILFVDEEGNPHEKQGFINLTR